MEVRLTRRPDRGTDAARCNSLLPQVPGPRLIGSDLFWGALLGNFATMPGFPMVCRDFQALLTPPDCVRPGMVPALRMMAISAWLICRKGWKNTGAPVWLRFS